MKRAKSRDYQGERGREYKLPYYLIQITLKGES